MRADKEGWSRDLWGKIRVAAEAKVNSAMVNSMVNSEKRVSENKLIEVAAETQKSIILGHRRDIGHARRLVMEIFGELKYLTYHNLWFKELGETMREPDGKGKDLGTNYITQ